MKTYKLTFELLGPLTRIPNSMTFFGAICHAIKSRYDKIQLESWLLSIKEKPSRFSVSSIFIKNTLPFPLDINPVFSHEGQHDLSNATQTKLIKKVSLISPMMYQIYVSNPQEFNQNFYHHFSCGDYCLALGYSLLIHRNEETQYSKKANYITTINTRNKVNLGQDTSLFYDKVMYFSKGYLFDAYISVEKEQDFLMVEEALKKLELLSMGGKRSLGYNLFKYKGYEEVHFPKHERKVLLSKAIDLNRIINYDNSYYKIKVLNNKYDYTINSVYKQGLVVFEEGSCLDVEAFTIGNLVEEHYNNMIIYQNAIGLLI